MLQHGSISIKKSSILTYSIVWLRRPDIVLTRILIQNGCAVFATWATIGFIMGFANLLTNIDGVDGTISSTIALSILLACLLFYFFIDLFILAQVLIFQYTSYLTVIWLFVGILAKNISATSGQRYFSLWICKEFI